MRYQIFPKDSCPLLDIESIGYAKSPEVTRFGPGLRSAYIIHYILSGKGFFNGHPVSAGQGFCITPGMLEEYYPDRSDPWEFLWILSGDEKMADLFEYYPYDRETNIFRYHYIHQIRAVADMLVADTNSVYNAFEMLEVFLRIFNHQLRDGNASHGSSPSDIYIEAALNYIRTNVSHSIKVSELTEILGISQPYLYRIFREKFGKSPKQYMNDYKLEQAKKLLKEPDITVTQAAHSVGFSDVLSFSRFFSLRTGCSPQSYRMGKQGKGRN